jgi:geranylgeranyl pyrophosphate synthase
MGVAFGHFLNEKQKLIEARLLELVPSMETEPKRLHEAVHYSLFADAKRIRPIFSLAVASIFKVPEDELLDAGCALEMVHTCSLILDDLPCMDDATIRRGKPANHTVYGEDTAILAAMFLLNRAYGVLAGYRKTFFSPSLSATLAGVLSRSIGTEGVIGGQFVDLQSKDKSIDLERLEMIHSRKTGALFSAAAEMAASFGKARDLDRMAVLTFAKNLGLAFQISDDILDATSDVTTIGKDTNKDTGKTTFITFCGLDGARSLAKELIETAVEALTPLKSRADLLRSFADFVLRRTK